MAHIKIPSDVSVRYVETSGGTNLLFGAMFAVGLVGFVAALLQNPDGAWISYVANWLFFTSVAMGAVIFAVATTIVKARWNWSVRRVSVSFAAFLPIAFVMLLPMLGLREGYFPWIEAMAYDVIVQRKQAYLNMPFLITRNLVGVAALFGLGLYFAYLSVRPDLGLAQAAGNEGRGRWHERFMAHWRGQEQEEVRSWHRLTVLAPPIVLVYAAVMSMLSFDWAMSLEPHWFSTLFGAWFFMGAFWGGIAATALSVVWLRGRHPDFRNFMGLQQRHDLGKLAFAFCVFWTYLFWSQYIVIWYGKLPWEQAWMIHRAEAPWGSLSVLTIVLCFIVPFAGLLGRRAKMKPRVLGFFTAVILVGLWLERYLLIAPSLHHEGDPTFPWYHPFVALMFAGLFLFSVRWFWNTFPVIQVWQPAAPPEMLEAEGHGAGTPAGGTAGAAASD
jgi:hypothetical protein